jgi:hypothetical protein
MKKRQDHNQEINAVLVMPDVEKRLISEGAEPATKSPEAPLACT